MRSGGILFQPAGTLPGNKPSMACWLNFQIIHGGPSLDGLKGSADGSVLFEVEFREVLYSSPHLLSSFFHFLTGGLEKGCLYSGQGKGF